MVYISILLYCSIVFRGHPSAMYGADVIPLPSRPYSSSYSSSYSSFCQSRTPSISSFQIQPHHGVCLRSIQKGVSTISCLGEPQHRRRLIKVVTDCSVEWLNILEEALPIWEMWCTMSLPIIWFRFAYRSLFIAGT